MARKADDFKADDVLLLDLRKLTIVSDFFIICGSRSTIGVKAVAEDVLHDFKKQGILPSHVEGLSDGEWVLIDFGDAILHVFQEEVRELFDLESLWGDAPRRDFRLKKSKTPAKKKDAD